MATGYVRFALDRHGRPLPAPTPPFPVGLTPLERGQPVGDGHEGLTRFLWCWEDRVAVAGESVLKGGLVDDERPEERRHELEVEELDGREMGADLCMSSQTVKESGCEHVREGIINRRRGAKLGGRQGRTEDELGRKLKQLDSMSRTHRRGGRGFFVGYALRRRKSCMSTLL